MFHSLPHFLTPTQTSPPERTAPDSLRLAFAPPMCLYGRAATGGREARQTSTGRMPALLTARSPDSPRSYRPALIQPLG